MLVTGVDRIFGTAHDRKFLRSHSSTIAFLDTWFSYRTYDPTVGDVVLKDHGMVYHITKGVEVYTEKSSIDFMISVDGVRFTCGYENLLENLLLTILNKKDIIDGMEYKTLVYKLTGRVLE